MVPLPLRPADLRARVSDCHGSLLLSNWRVVIPGRSQAGANSSAKKKAPDAHPKPFDPNATPIRVIVDVLRHDDSRAVLKGPVTSQALFARFCSNRVEERAAREADEIAAIDSVGDYESDPNVMLEDVPQDIVIKTQKVSCACVPVLVFACVCVCVCACA